MPADGIWLWVEISAADAAAVQRGSKSPMTVQHEDALHQETTGQTTSGVILSDAAATKVGALLAQEGRDDLRLRIAVQPGGCSGLRYQLYFDERELDGDIDAEFSGVHVVTDKMSAPYLMGATIDFVDTIEKQGFTIDNPNATGSCACGDSFH
jgi:iron-sulfur cluster assembly accessory protein